MLEMIIPLDMMTLINSIKIAGQFMEPNIWVPEREITLIATVQDVPGPADNVTPLRTIQ